MTGLRVQANVDGQGSGTIFRLSQVDVQDILCSEEGFGEIRCGWEIIRADNVVIVSVKAIALYVVFIFKELRAICWGRARIKGNMLLMGNGLGQSIVVGKN